MTKMTDFQKSRDKKSNHVQDGISREKRENRESVIVSPIIDGRSKTVGGIKKTERMTITLPVSGIEIELTSTEAVPSECVVHPRNQRVQALLRVENPRVASLKEAIEKDRQRERVLSRWINVDGNKVLEVLDGSRRRFVCDLIHQQNPKVLLKSWVGNIPDIDAEYFAKHGNDDRDDVSPWEKARALKQIELENPSWSHEVIAANERMSRQSVSNLLSIADIPLTIVSLLESPDLLTVNSGLQIGKLIREAKNDRYIDILSKEAPFSKFIDLAKRLKELLNPKATVTIPSANRKIEIKKGNTVRASIGVNRKNPGQYKVDLFSLSETEYEYILKALEKILQ
jgi:ParB/RepB/Spo0J family partition protein